MEPIDYVKATVFDKVQNWIASRSWKFWLIVVFITLFILWLIFGGKRKDYKYIGLDPLLPGSDIVLPPETLNVINTLNGFRSDAPINKDNDNMGNDGLGYDSDPELLDSDIEIDTSERSSSRHKIQSPRARSPRVSSPRARSSRENRFSRNHSPQKGDSPPKVQRGNSPIHLQRDPPLHLQRDSPVHLQRDPQGESHVGVFRVSPPPPMSSTRINEVPRAMSPPAKGGHPKLRQNECKRILEKIYNKPFQSDVHPPFLKNPQNKTGVLELDCYNEELKIALEHQGEQHYIYPNRWHKDEAAFEKGLQYDRFKKEVCENNDIWLIIVPYHVPFNKLEEYIWGQLPDETIPLP